jgi:hypothetical protein
MVLNNIAKENKLPDDLVADYAQRFYGFGTPTAKVWLIGMEEAAGATFDEVDARLRAWDERGRKEWENTPLFHRSGAKSRPGANDAIDPTWKQLIRMLLLARGERDSQKAILDHYQTDFGATSGKTCLAQLLPLLSAGASSSEWPYQNWSTLDWLASRALYLKELKSRRMNHLKERVAEHHPKVVIFYGTTLADGTSLLPVWVQIAGRGRFGQAIEGQRILLAQQTEHTLFLVTRHPLIETDAYFQQIGKFLHEQHPGSF